MNAWLDVALVDPVRVPLGVADGLGVPAPEALAVWEALTVPVGVPVGDGVGRGDDDAL